jgi:copper transport protein
VHITFDEEIDLPDGPAIEVLDSAGRRVDKNDCAIDPDDATAVLCHLGALARGSYTVRWRVVSADTHVVHGSFTFGVGVAAERGEVEGESPFDPSAPIASILRWLTFLGIVLAAGAIFFRLAFRRVLDPPFAAAVSRHVRAGGIVALLASIVLLAVQSIASAGNVIRGLSWAGALSTLHSPFGVPWLVRIIALFVLLLCAALTRPGELLLGSLAAASALVSFSVAGHATAPAVYATPAAMEAVDWVHQASICAWLGGVAVLVAGLTAMRERTGEFVRTWLARFSKVAVPAVALMLATGVYASLAHEPNVTLLLTTEWGVALAVKVALVLLLLGFGALSLRAGLGGQLRFSGLVLRVELILAVCILAVTGFLVGQSPPTCMFMPAGVPVPANMKMPPGMQMCSLYHHFLMENVHVD